MVLEKDIGREAIPDCQSIGLIEKVSLRFPFHKPLILLIRHVAFDSDDTIPHDYLWRNFPGRAGSGERQERDFAKRADKNGAPLKDSTHLSAREKDRRLIARLVLLETQLDSLLDEGDRDKIQDLLFEYVKASQARMEHVRSAYFQDLDECNTRPSKDSIEGKQKR